MLSLILGFITGLAGPISATITSILHLQEMKTQSLSDVEKADLNRQIQEVSDKKAVLIAEAGSRIGSTITSLLQLLAALPMLAILWKYSWDKVIGGFNGCAAVKLTPLKTIYCQEWFRTDVIDPNVWWIILSIISFLFVTTISKVWKR